MKKILFLLLLTTSSYGQALFDKGVKITGGITTDNTAPNVVVKSSNNVLNTISKTELQDAFYFATASALPVVGITDKLYITRDDNKLYRFDGSVYQPLSADVSNLVTLNTPQTITALKTIKDTYLRIVNDNVPNPRGLAVFQNNSSQAGAVISFNKSRGTNAVPTAGVVNDIIGAFEFKPFVGSSYVTDRSTFGASMTSATGISQFFIAGNTNNNFTPNLLIHENKKVGIGALGGSIVAGLTAPTAMLQVKSLGTTTDSALLIQNSANTSLFDIKDNGRVLFNKITDDGTNLAQFNGTISVATATQPNQAPRLEQVIQTTGIQTATGRKVFNSDNTTAGGITVSNNKTTGGGDAYGFAVYNTGLGGIYAENTGTGSTGNALQITNSSNTGNGILVGNFGTGVGINLRNQGGTGDLLNAEVNTTRILSTGRLQTTLAPVNANDVVNLNAIKSRDGWASYSTTTFTNASPFTVAPNTTVTLPNNANNSITTDLPLGVTAFYNGTTNKITPAAIGDAYTVNVRFKARTTMNNDYLTLFIDIGAGTQINAEAKQFLKGANTEQPFSFTMPIFTLDTFVANGGEIKVASNSGTISIYDVTFFINRNYTRQ